MKKILIGLLALGSLSSFAQTFSGEYKGHYIHKSSNSDALCRVLTKNSAAKSVSVEYERHDRADCFYKIKKNGAVNLRCNEDPI